MLIFLLITSTYFPFSGPFFCFSLPTISKIDPVSRRSQREGLKVRSNFLTTAAKYTLKIKSFFFKEVMRENLVVYWNIDLYSQKVCSTGPLHLVYLYPTTTTTTTYFFFSANQSDKLGFVVQPDIVSMEISVQRMSSSFL